MTKRICEVEDCGQSHYGKGYCVRHYRRWAYYKDHSKVREPSKRLDRATVLAFVATAVAYTGDDCLEWPFPKRSHGYGTITVDRKLYTAHNYILRLTQGDPPPGKKHAAHAAGICHNRACVNPKHLRWATVSENGMDKVIDGTATRGEANAIAILTEDVVLDLAFNGVPAAEMAYRLGVSVSTIFKIREGLRWGWLTGIEPKKRAA